jgi:hypothetical protein
MRGLLDGHNTLNGGQERWSSQTKVNESMTIVWIVTSVPTMTYSDKDIVIDMPNIMIVLWTSVKKGIQTAVKAF